jgi:hypothetical protein
MDKFYTCDKVVDDILCKINKLVTITDNDLVLEPSAGNGSFLKKLRYLNVVALDIQPESDNIQSVDFFEYEVPSTYDKIHVIGNPPFGRNGSVALRFMKHSMKFAESVSFVLPRSFMKDSFLMRIPKGFELVYNEILPQNSFLKDGDVYDVPCVFQIWIKNPLHMMTFEKTEPQGYRFVKKDETHDIAFRRVGGRSGLVTASTQDCNVNCFYFIKFEVDFDIAVLQSISWEDCRNNTAGPRSISKRELVLKFNEVV